MALLWSVVALLLSSASGQWSQQGPKLTPTPALAYQGYSVTLTDSGSYLAVSGPEINGARGAVWIYVNNNNGTWTFISTMLIGNDPTGPISYQGWSIDFSSDGTTLADGAYYDDHTQGAVWIFVKDPTKNNTWVQQGTKLVGTGYTSLETQQGTSVGLSSDGNTLVSGGPNDGDGLGAVWIFQRTGSTWAQQGKKLTGSDATSGAMFGRSVAITSDGNTIAIGGSGDDGMTGAVWLFTRKDSTWTQNGNKLIGTDSTGPANQGIALALNSGGDTLVVGGNADNSHTGAFWVFTRSGSTWSQQGAKIVGPAGSTAGFGYALALSTDGNVLAVGANSDDKFIGSTWVYNRVNGNYTLEGSKLVGTGNVGPSEQGCAVALTSDGKLLASGGYHDNSFVGAVWLFAHK